MWDRHRILAPYKYDLTVPTSHTDEHCMSLKSRKNLFLTLYLFLGRYIDGLMNTEPLKRMYQQSATSPSLKQEKHTYNTGFYKSSHTLSQMCILYM